MKSTVVMIVHDFPKLSETFIVSKFLGLIEQGWDVHLACVQFNREQWGIITSRAEEKQQHRRIHPNFLLNPRWLAVLFLPFVVVLCFLRIPKVTLRYFKQVWPVYKAKTVWHLYQDARILFLKPDLLHFEFGALAPERMYLKDVLGCKVLVSFRGYDLNFVGLEEPKHYDPVWQHADALHLLGDDLWARAVRRGCPPDKMHALIPPGIDLAFFNAPLRFHEEFVGTSERPLRILSVGRLEWKKGYEHAFHAVRQLFDQHIAFEYRIIGDGNYFEPLSFLRHQLGLDSYIDLCGAQPREVVREQMLWADVFLHAAVSEGFCNAVIEAQAMGLPVVTSDADGLPENVQDTITGYVVPRRNSAVMAEKLIELARNTTLRQQMGTAGQARVRQKFDLDSQIEKFNQLYLSLLGSK